MNNLPWGGGGGGGGGGELTPFMLSSFATIVFVITSLFFLIYFFSKINRSFRNIFRELNSFNSDQAQRNGLNFKMVNNIMNQK